MIEKQEDLLHKEVDSDQGDSNHDVSIFRVQIDIKSIHLGINCHKTRAPFPSIQEPGDNRILQYGTGDGDPKIPPVKIQIQGSEKIQKLPPVHSSLSSNYPCTQ